MEEHLREARLVDGEIAIRVPLIDLLLREVQHGHLAIHANNRSVIKRPQIFMKCQHRELDRGVAGGMEGGEFNQYCPLSGQQALTLMRGQLSAMTAIVGPPT